MDRFEELIKKEEELKAKLTAKEEALNGEIEKNSREYYWINYQLEEKGKEIDLTKSDITEFKKYQGKSILLTALKEWFKVLIEKIKKGFKEKPFISILKGMGWVVWLPLLSAILNNYFGLSGLLSITAALISLLGVASIIEFYINRKRALRENSIEDLEQELKELKKRYSGLEVKKILTNERINQRVKERNQLSQEISEINSRINFLNAKRLEAINLIITEKLLNEKFDEMNIEAELKRLLEKKAGE